MEKNNKPKENEGLRQLDPKKYLVRKVFRKYRKGEPVTKPPKKPIYIEFPEKTKEIALDVLSFVLKNIGKISIFLLSFLILLFIFLILLPPIPKASFFDKTSNEYTSGYVYFDDKFIGYTDGKIFNKFPKEYCYGTHIVRLESGSNAFEWQTYSGDCLYKKISFNVEHKKAKHSKNIVFKFLDSTGSYYIAGKLYFNDVFFEQTFGELAITRDLCMNISKIKIENEDFSAEKQNNKELCNSTDKVEFRIS